MIYNIPQSIKQLSDYLSVLYKLNYSIPRDGLTDNQYWEIRTEMNKDFQKLKKKLTRKIRRKLQYRLNKL